MRDWDDDAERGEEPEESLKKKQLAWLGLFSVVMFAPYEGAADRSSALATPLPNPILFVTQVPLPGDFTTITSTFGNQLGSLSAAPRGGDLWIRYPDGSLKNLTRTAGYGVQGMQGPQAIAVREPSVHWSGTKALFSMVIGAPQQQYQVSDYYWQIYEVSSLGGSESPLIHKIANQPAGYNNVSPIYGTDDRILSPSDRPRD